MAEDSPAPTAAPAAAPAAAAPAAGGLARAASITALGSVASRLVGLLRETVKSDLFGATAHVSAFEVAALVPNQLYDLLVGGMVSSALVPVFSEYLARDDEAGLWRLFGALLTFAAATLALLLLVLELGAGLIAAVLGAGFSADTLAETVALLRIALPAVFFLSLSGVLSGLLYALKRFTLPALVPVAFNLTIVAAALALGPRLGVASLALGFTAGAALQVLLQLPGLRGARLRPNLDWRQPGLARILQLYGPVIAGLVVTQVSIAIAVSLASHTGDRSIAWMRYATFIFQFPLGLVSSAIAVAILPTLSRHAAEERAGAPGAPAAFRATLTRGLRLVLLLVIPATAGLLVLGRPVVGLLYEHGSFTAGDAEMTTAVLDFFLLGLVFAAIDQPLVFAFYARQDTLTPALAGVAGMLIYLAAGLVPLLVRPLAITDLALANAIQLTSHALLMIVLIDRRLRRASGGAGLGGQGLGGQGLGGAALRAGLGALLMAPPAYLVELGVRAALAGLPLLAARATALAAAGLTGLAVYVAVLWLLRAPELAEALRRARALAPRRTGAD